jgi:hypothetical protein
LITGLSSTRGEASEKIRRGPKTMRNIVPPQRTA